MTFYRLPLTNTPRQILSLTIAPDGEALSAKAEVRYLPGANQWFFSLWDESTGEQLINQIPLISSFGSLNDLLYPFRHLRQGRGLGSLTVVPLRDQPSTPDPTETNLTDFLVIWSDSL